MKDKFNPSSNYAATMNKIGYVNRKDATQADYDRIGFMSGLEVHQQLKTEKKLFCKCKAGIFHKDDNYDAELIRHMRPTLSELGEYDGTALMEFKTRKEIIYRINNENACTYEIDDTPPFLINREALDKALEITILSKFNVVGEVHITRKQYLDGSIPAGFQRTAILGVEGEIELKNKKVRLIQLSIEEDSCREISDIGHVRVYKTDRLGTPLIETVTYPDMVNPDEVKEACDYIRFLNRSTGNVRTGMGAGRQDVNVSCKGGTRVEIKGVAHTKWIPELTHNECYRQWSLLAVRDELHSRVKDADAWSIKHAQLNFEEFNITRPSIQNAKDSGQTLIAVCLPHFKGILSYFNQPGIVFADEISDRLKVIACLEKPNMVHTEMHEQVISNDDIRIIKKHISFNEDQDAIILFWAPEADIATALETIEERCKMAFEGVPNETRKSFEDGTTMFERVLPGADRMYPDTDSMPIPLAPEHIDRLSQNVQNDISERISQLRKWGVPEFSYTYIFSKNLYPYIKQAIEELNLEPKIAGRLFGQDLKSIEGRYEQGKSFIYSQIIDLLKYTQVHKLYYPLDREMLTMLYKNPDMDFETILKEVKFVEQSKDELLTQVKSLSEQFDKEAKNKSVENKQNWIMGQIRKKATGNICLSDLKEEIIRTIN